jgi:hypothetical protein
MSLVPSGPTRGSIIVKWLTVDFVDLVVGGGLTGLFFIVSMPEIATMTGVATALFGAMKYSLKAEMRQIQLEMAKELLPLQQIRQVIDIEQSSNVEQVDGIRKVYLGILEPEFRSVKDSILFEANERLLALSHQKTSEELGTGAYYTWLLPMLAEMRAGERISAVSLMYDAEWDDSEVERKFVEENLAAARRGVSVQRIFIIPQDKLSAALQNEAIALHLKEADNGLDGYFVRREDLEHRDPDLLRRAGDGFIKISDRVALIDKFGAAGEVRGKVTMNQADIRFLATIFSQLLLQATKLTATHIQNPARPLLQGPKH